MKYIFVCFSIFFSFHNTGALDIPPQAAITRDNVSVEVSGNLFIQFVDAEKAAYGALNPLYSVTQHAQSAMRSAIGEMELDEAPDAKNFQFDIKGIMAQWSGKDTRK